MPGDATHSDVKDDDLNLDQVSNRNSFHGKNDPQVFEALAERAFVNLGIDNEPKVSTLPQFNI